MLIAARYFRPPKPIPLAMVHAEPLSCPHGHKDLINHCMLRNQREFRLRDAEQATGGGGCLLCEY